jgi:hypothetical protein
VSSFCKWAVADSDWLVVELNSLQSAKESMPRSRNLGSVCRDYHEKTSIMKASAFTKDQLNRLGSFGGYVDHCSAMAREEV